MEYTAVVIATPIASERIAKRVKSGVAPSRLRASLMSLTTRGSVASLVAQGDKLHWTRNSPQAQAIDANFQLSSSATKPLVCEVSLGEMLAFSLSRRSSGSSMVT
jgi:hypothetical protein